MTSSWQDRSWGFELRNPGQTPGTSGSSALDIPIFDSDTPAIAEAKREVSSLRRLVQLGSYEAAHQMVGRLDIASSEWPPDLKYTFQSECAWLEYLVGRLDVALKSSASLVSLLKHTSHTQQLGLCQFVLGATLMSLGRNQEAVRALTAALHIFDWQLGQRLGSFKAMNMLGVAYKRCGRLTMAEDSLIRAVEIAHELDDSVFVASASLNLAVVQAKRGRVSPALLTLDSLVKTGTTATPPKQMRTHLAIAQIKNLSLDAEAAELHLAAALKTLRRNPRSRDAILFREYSADAKALLGEHGSALRLLDRALWLARMRFPGSDLICEIQRRRARVLIELERLEEAANAADEAVAVSESVAEPLEIALALRSAGNVALARALNSSDRASSSSASAKAIDCLRSAVTLLEDIGELPERAVTLFELAAAHGATGDKVEAVIATHHALHAFRQMSIGVWVSRCEQLRSKLEIAPLVVLDQPTVATQDLARFGLITEDSRIIESFRMLRQVAPSTLPVLIEGESGTGKELFARALHLLSARPEGPFLPLNCGAISPDMQEAEFFGHARGSFTGAITERIGYFESANHGTLFLDEIGEMSLATQVKLLRVIESGELCRVGETRTRRVDVRYVAATNRGLDASVERRDFRLDLLQRLNGLRIVIPPLRERRGDIPRLIDHFLRMCAGDPDKPPFLAQSLMGLLVGYDWPGNVRELRLAVERAVILAGTSHQLTEAHFPQLKRNPGLISDGQTLTADLARIERARILDALEKSRWSKSVAARLLGLSRTTFNSKMQRYGIPFEAPDRFRTPKR